MALLDEFLVSDLLLASVMMSDPSLGHSAASQGIKAGICIIDVRERRREALSAALESCLLAVVEAGELDVESAVMSERGIDRRLHGRGSKSAIILRRCCMEPYGRDQKREHNPQKHGDYDKDNSQLKYCAILGSVGGFLARRSFFYERREQWNPLVGIW